MRPTWTEVTSGDRVTQLTGPEGYRRPGRETDVFIQNPATTGSWQTPTPSFLAGLPREEPKLRERLYQDVAGHGPSDDGEVLTYVADVLRSGLVPADLRRSLFGVLQTVPGVEVAGPSVSIDGATGVGIGRLEPRNGTRQEIVVDPTNGQVIGEREIQVDGGGGVAPGTVTLQVRVTRTPVDDAPVALKAEARRSDCVRVDGDAMSCAAS